MLLFAAALVATVALPSYASAASGLSGDPASLPGPVQQYQVPDYDAP